jgi:hypothetical protein
LSAERAERTESRFRHADPLLLTKEATRIRKKVKGSAESEGKAVDAKFVLALLEAKFIHSGQAISKVTVVVLQAEIKRVTDGA